MKHRWQIGYHSAKTHDNFLARARTCEKCGKTQVYDVIAYDRLCVPHNTYGWRPLIGRCSGNVAK